MAAGKFERQNGRWGRIRGNWATLILPINDDDSIDFSRLAGEIEHLIAAGVDGIYSNGTAGEFHNQTEEEFDAIQQLLADRCKPAAMPFIIGACQPDPRISLERVRRAARLEPEAIQVILPDWWPVTTAEATDFLQMAAEAAGSIPLVLYHPPHAKRVFAPAELAAILAPVPQVVGVKLADGDLSWYEQARHHLGAWGLYVPGHHLATGVKQDVAVGAFSNVACLNPSGAQRWTASMASDIERALEVEERLRAFLEVHITPLAKVQGYSNAALDKLLAAIGGWADVGTRLRRPYRWLDPQIVPGLREKAKAALPEIML
ncbi:MULTISPECIES: dihydrodipicolinate synthase family protein [unclassified Sinorhizobium]|uniref:dihydrodipicolinate synthase family protein n=1 Tax=unclassified Sinorhizobium TaxID=2613772 RepID=UPI0024C2B908|nr:MULTISPECIES: dihydrodipicolinate synthase family protein [unclassified Sinorhizobium]MDK1374528.1 dihydrodipicolinate synthase family protein [Sinorhizobium sp. 6-70]MDK1479142.1 dihydrodipicolinate synthase family protein [Sinorhizobium sp. 6-117]